MIVKCFNTQFGTVQCAVSLFDSATVVARPVLNESSQLREGRHKNATPKTANRPVFCFVSTRCLVYYFLLFLDPNLTILYLAMLAGLGGVDDPVQVKFE